MKIDDPPAQYWPNILLIAGTGRNSGKTTLAERIIRRFALKFDITAVKISPHFHRGTPQLERIIRSDHFNIYEERGRGMEKDSERMAAAGARRVYYAEVEDVHLPDAFEALSGLLPKEKPVVIESPALGVLIRPGVFFITDHPQTVCKKAEVMALMTHADLIINTEAIKLDDIVNRLDFQGSGWVLQDQ